MIAIGTVLSSTAPCRTRKRRINRGGEGGGIWPEEGEFVKVREQKFPSYDTDPGSSPVQFRRTLSRGCAILGGVIKNRKT